MPELSDIPSDVAKLIAAEFSKFAVQDGSRESWDPESTEPIAEYVAFRNRSAPLNALTQTSKDCYELFVGSLYQEITLGTIHLPSVLGLILRNPNVAEAVRSLRFLDGPAEKYKPNSKYMERYDFKTQAKAAEECFRLAPSLLSIKQAEIQEDEDGSPIVDSRSPAEIERRNVTDQLRSARALLIDSLPNLLDLEATSATAFHLAKIDSPRGRTVVLKGLSNRLSKISVLSNINMKNAAFIMLFLENLREAKLKVFLDAKGLKFVDGLEEVGVFGKSKIRKIELELTFISGYSLELGKDPFSSLLSLSHSLESVKAFYPFVDSGSVPQYISFTGCLKPSTETLTHLSISTFGSAMPFSITPQNITHFAASGDYWRDIGNLKNRTDMFSGMGGILPMMSNKMRILELNESSHFWSELWFRIVLGDYLKVKEFPESLKIIRIWRTWSNVHGQQVKPKGRELRDYQENRNDLLKTIKKCGFTLEYIEDSEEGRS